MLGIRKSNEYPFVTYTHIARDGNSGISFPLNSCGCEFPIKDYDYKYCKGCWRCAECGKYGHDPMHFGPMLMISVPVSRELQTAVSHVVDAIIEREGDCGMTFGGIVFEARWKSNNDRAYPKNKRVENFTVDDLVNILKDVEAYLDPCDHSEIEDYDVGLEYGGKSNVVKRCKKCLVYQ